MTKVVIPTLELFKRNNKEGISISPLE